MQVESIEERSLGAFCNTFDLHCAIIGLDKTNIFCLLLSGLLRQGLLYTVTINEYPILEVKKKEFFDRPTHTSKTGLGKGKQNYF